MKVIHKSFRVAHVSSNANSFGLSGHILIARDGTAFEVGRSRCGNYPVKWERGSDVSIPYSVDKEGRPESPVWGAVSCEIPRELPVCPPKVLKEIFA